MSHCFFWDRKDRQEHKFLFCVDTLLYKINVRPKEHKNKRQEIIVVVVADAVTIRACIRSNVVVNVNWRALVVQPWQLVRAYVAMLDWM